MKRRYRLRHSSDFQRVRHDGKSHASSLVALAFLQNELDYSRFGFVVSKRLGAAVHRNKIKRRLREMIRLHFAGIKAGFDIVVIARQPARLASYAELEQALLQLLAKAGLLVPQVKVSKQETQLQTTI
jgi:ribonuclease P protein component